MHTGTARTAVAFGAVAVLACLVAPSALGQTSPRPAGQVKVAAGTATAERQGQTHALRAGDPVFEADLLRTGPDGRLGVTLKDQTRLSLGPGTEVSLATFAFAPAEQRFGLVLRLARGVLEYVSGRLGKLAPDSIRIETPSSIVGVRGTHLLVGASLP